METNMICREVRQWGAVDSDAVDLTVNENRSAAVSLCCRLAGVRRSW
jgi:hypothetical protein